MNRIKTGEGQGKTGISLFSFIRVHLKLLFAAILILAGSAACSETPAQAVTATTKASPTMVINASASSTATIDWFPATATATLPPTPLPATAAPLATPPPIGELIFKDDFSNQTLWVSGEFAAGTIAYGQNELNLAISQAHGILTSQRPDPVLTNFYLQISVTPSLCLNSDYFGVMFRMASPYDFYRFSQTCTGQIRLERLKQGSGVVLHDWSLSAQALPAPGGTYRLGIWANGSDLRFYIDDVLQFSVKDSSLESGGLAVFARSMGDNPVTVTFADLDVYQPGSTLLPTAATGPTAPP